MSLSWLEFFGTAEGYSGAFIYDGKVAAVCAMEELDQDLPIVKLAPPCEALDASGFVKEWKKSNASGLPKKSFCWGCAQLRGQQLVAFVCRIAKGKQPVRVR